MFVERFMAWSVSAGADQRAEAIGQLVRNYLDDGIAAEDRGATEQVFTLYLDDPSAKVRATMAAALAVGEVTPRTLIWSLAEDIPEVSVEIYAASPSLRTVDLVHAINRGDPTVQVAIARRQDHAGDSVRALVAEGCDRAVLCLLENESVVLGPGLKHDIATRLGDVPAIRTHLMNEHDLLPATRQLLVERLADSLLSLTGSNGWGNFNRMANSANDACSRAAIDIAMRSDNSEMPAYVVHLRDTDQLTPALLIRAICAGNAALFEAAISLLSGSSLKRVQSIVDAARISAFRALYGSTGLPESAYAVFVAAINTWREDGLEEDVLKSIIEKVEDDPTVDGALFALLGRMASEEARDSAKHYDRQLLLAAA